MTWVSRRSSLQALADEYRVPFFETSAKSNANVDDVFQSVARTVMANLRDHLPTGHESAAAAGGGAAVRLGTSARYAGQKAKPPASSSCC